MDLPFILFILGEAFILFSLVYFALIKWVIDQGIVGEHLINLKKLRIKTKEKLGNNADVDIHLNHEKNIIYFKINGIFITTFYYKELSLPLKHYTILKRFMGIKRGYKGVEYSNSLSPDISVYTSKKEEDYIISHLSSALANAYFEKRKEMKNFYDNGNN